MAPERFWFLISVLVTWQGHFIKNSGAEHLWFVYLAICMQHFSKDDPKNVLFTLPLPFRCLRTVENTGASVLGRTSANQTEGVRMSSIHQEDNVMVPCFPKVPEKKPRTEDTEWLMLWSTDWPYSRTQAYGDFYECSSGGDSVRSQGPAL